MKFGIAAIALVLILDFIFPFKINENYSTVVLDNKKRILSSYLNGTDKWRYKCHSSEISPFLRKAILFKEDKYFYYHPGVNPIAIIRASISNVSKNKRVSGASTITMQVVRLIYPKKRSYGNKCIEMLRALQLEMHYSKEEILALYLNLLPQGSNIEGVKTASYIYLNKHPSKLSLAEALTLCLIPNKPSLIASKNSGELATFKEKWLAIFEKNKIFKPEEIQFARKERVIFNRTSPLKQAPHFCERLKKASVEPYIFSSLNLNLQLQIESQVKSYLERLKSIGLKNASVLVINNKTMEVLSYCGSGSYENKTDGGQVDGIQAIRSPGSTLKPYLYALALEKGQINPKAIVYDIPIDIGGFKPVNFDNTYVGQVSVQDALQLSLNIPAVKILEEYGLQEFLVDLKKANFKSIKENEEKLGLSTILGGCGVSMEEMVKLYASFANAGIYQDLIFDKSGQKKQTLLLDSASTYIVSNMLSGVQRPDFPNNFEFTFKLPKIAWKTGTSFGKRDAWAIGYNPNYTIGVWLGNFSGESIPLISGASVATPLLFQIFNTTETSRPWFDIPKNIAYKEVCAVSGLPKNTYCTSISMDKFVGKVFYKKKCQHLKTVWTNASESITYCNRCLDKSTAIAKQYINIPAYYQDYLQENGMAYERVPPHNPACQHLKYSQELAILSPRNQSLYYIERKSPQQMQLKASAASGTDYLLWYHNNTFLGKFNPNESVFISPEIGKNHISCTDNSGKTVKIVFEAKAM